MAFSKVVTDPLRYKQIVLYLLTNAIKFTALQSGKKEIVITLNTKLVKEYPAQQNLVLSIQDTGRGMSAEAIQRLFGTFSLASERTHTEYEGSGLGLFISQRLSALLGGKIHITSEIGKGSVFALEIPCRPSEVVHCKSEHESRQSEDLAFDGLELFEIRAKPHSETPPSPTAADRLEAENYSEAQAAKSEQKASLETETSTILVIEDNLINQKLMIKQLTRSGYRVLVANHGLEALEHFNNGEHIDLVVTDIEMPMMNGIETLAAVRALGPTIVKSQPPFIACSAYAREEQRQSFIDAGMIDVLAKPHKYVDLKARVEHILKHHTPFAAGV